MAASRASSIPELLGDLNATFDPRDSADMARCLRDLLESPEKLEALRERSEKRAAIYTWERVARRTLEGYERAERITDGWRPPRPGRARRKRLAVVTPWPPQQSASARYSRELVSGLAEHAEIEVVVLADDSDLSFDESLDSIRLRTDAEFDWLRAVDHYDRCLFVLGGSRFHIHAFEAMSHVPGVVLADDVRLLSLYRALHRHRFLYDPYWLENKLVEMYGDRIPRADLERVAFDEGHADAGLTMTGEMQSNAQKVLVHSRHQAELLRLDRSAGAAPTERVPFAIPTGGPSPSGTKCPLVLVAAAGCSDPERRALLAELRAAVRSARILAVDEDDGSADLHQRADVAVSVQTDPDGGRPSIAVAEWIAARVPTIVTAVGWQGELPDDVVLRVPADGGGTLLGSRVRSLLAEEDLRRTMRAAQDEFAERCSPARVAERYAELLDL